MTCLGIKRRNTCRGLWPAALSAGVGALAACAVALGGCKKAAPPPPMPPPQVKVAVVQQRDVPVYGQWIGTLDGYVNAQIRAQVTGYLLSQDYQEGGFVHKGQLLFKIDPRTFEAALHQAEGNLAKDTATAKNSRIEASRLDELLKRGAATIDERDQARALADSQEAAVRADQAALETARLQLGYTDIVSPVDGIAGLAAAQVGDLVGATGPVLTTVSTVDPIKALFNISEQDYMAFKGRFADSSLEMILSNGDVYPHKGTVFAMQREVDVRTGTLGVIGLFPNPGNILRPGQFARIRTQVSLRKGALLAPQRAVTQLQGTYQAAVVDADGRVRIRPVQVGERVGGEWVIEKGLSPGERVVAEGVQKVREGQLVHAVPFQIPAASSQP